MEDIIKEYCKMNHVPEDFRDRKIDMKYVVLSTVDEEIPNCTYTDGAVRFYNRDDDAVEHHILLNKIKGNSNDLDGYYRIVVDTDGADWTFVFPPDYKNILNKEKRIETFYKDGYETIKSFLEQIGYPQIINIPKRYTRHLDHLTNGDF